MITVNPFVDNVLNIAPAYIQGFLVLMVIFTVGGVILDMMHKKNVKFFFNNAKKAKLSATKSVSTGEKTAIILDLFTFFHQCKRSYHWTRQSANNAMHNNGF